MSGKLWTCILDPRSPRYYRWHEILNSNDVPSESAHTYWANMGAETEVEIYPLDITAMNPGQRIRLANWICDEFNEELEEVEKDLDRIGFPIRAADVIVSFSMRAFL